jgi:hypothetical protein
MTKIMGIALNSINPDERVIRITYPKDDENNIVRMLEEAGIKVKRKSCTF